MPKLVPPPEGLDWYKNRRGLYIESGTGCIVRVLEVEVDDSEIRAKLCRDSDTPLVCFFQENPRRFTCEKSLSFGDTWTISKRWDDFFGDENYWDGSLYFGFRLLFSKDVVEQFLRQDLDWMEDYF